MSVLVFRMNIYVYTGALQCQTFCIAHMSASNDVVSATHAAPQPPNDAMVDMSSILARIKMLEDEKKAMAAELANNDAKYAKLQEAKQAEMEKIFNTSISRWLQQLETGDATCKKQLEDGLLRLANEANENPIWQVMACASSNWASNVNQIETLTTRINELQEKEKEWQNNQFASEESRVQISNVSGKRKADDMDQNVVSADIWSEFETMMMRGGGNAGAL